MKQFIFLMILMVFINLHLTAAHTHDDDEEILEQRLEDLRQKCIKQTNITKEEAKLIYQHRLFTVNSTLENTPKHIQCFSACYIEGFGIFVDGKPNETFLRQHLPTLINDKKKANDVITKCSKVKGEDSCALGFGFELCMSKESDLHFHYIAY